MNILEEEVEIIGGYQLTAKEREYFDYYTSEELDDADLFRFRGCVYDLASFLCLEPGGELNALGFDGYYGENYFSAVAIKLNNADSVRAAYISW